MPLLDIGERLSTPAGRLDLAADVIGAMVHPNDKTGRRRRRSALAVTLLGMRDGNDEPEALSQVWDWFRRAGSFKTASESDPYGKQQNAMLQQIPKMLTVGMALDLVWAMGAHHRKQLQGGASLHKALAILQDPIISSPISERGFWNAWSRYKPAAHFCAGFALAVQQAHDGAPGEIDERMKTAYHEDLDVTLSVIAAYQRFATGFTPHGQSRPLLDPNEIWFLRGVEMHDGYAPQPLSPYLLAVAQAYEAPRNKAYR